MIYELAKTTHLIALFVWIGGMVAAALALRYPGTVALEPLKAYDRAVTTPAMILALAMGVLLGVLGGWFTSAWLGIKIVFVLALSGLHGVLAGRLRRAAGRAYSERYPERTPFLPTGLVILLIVVFLVTTKAI